MHAKGKEKKNKAKGLGVQTANKGVQKTKEGNWALKEAELVSFK